MKHTVGLLTATVRLSITGSEVGLGGGHVVAVAGGRGVISGGGGLAGTLVVALIVSRPVHRVTEALKTRLGQQKEVPRPVHIVSKKTYY